PQYGAHVGSDLSGDPVELTVGRLAAHRQLGPHLLPPLRHFRYSLGVSNRPRHELTDSTCRHHGLVGPTNPAPCSDVCDALGTRLAPKSGVAERNHHDLPHALLAQECVLLSAESAITTIAERAAPRLPRQQHGSAGTAARFDSEPQSSRRTSTLATADDR